MILALLAVASACGRGSSDLVPVPADQMPNQEIPASAIPSMPDQDLAIPAGCQEAVVTSSSLEYLCCSAQEKPSSTTSCEAGWKKTFGACTLSFTDSPGELWSCGEEAPAENSPPPSTNSIQMSKKSDKFKLHETAYRLGMMPQAEYLELQYGYVKSKVPACNYFLISALCEAGRCENGVPWYRAAEFNEYLVKKGWKQLRLDQLKAWFVAGIEFDSILQKDGVTRSRMGHVAVPVGVGSDHRLHIAEGSFGTITNHVEAVRDGFVLNWNGGFRIFVRTP